MTPMHRYSSTTILLRAAGLSLAMVVLSGAALAQTPASAPLFPSPFLVEHRLLQTEPDGTTFAGDPVVDRYGGSWIVSERPDGRRLVVDFARRELTEIRPDRGTYSVLSFDRYAELSRRLRQAEGGVGETTKQEASSSEGPSTGTPGERAEPRFEIAEMPVRAGLKLGGRSELLSRPGVRHLTVALRLDDGELEPATVEVWVDPSLRLSRRAGEALDRLAGETLGGDEATGTPSFSRWVAAARDAADGALPIRTVRPLRAGVAAERAGTLEDLATRVEPLASFPLELVAVPDGLRRVAHPLETMVAFAEQEAARNRQALESARTEGGGER